MRKFFKKISVLVLLFLVACNSFGLDTNILSPINPNVSSSNTIDPTVLNSTNNTQTQTVSVGTSIPGNSKTGPNAMAGAAAGRIGNWISNNHCNE